MRLNLDIRFKVSDGDPAEEAKVRQIVAEESRKLAPAIAERLEAAAIGVEIEGVNEQAGGWRAELKRRLGV